MTILSSNPLFFCLTLLGVVLVLGFFPGLRIARTRWLWGVLYAAPYAVLSWIGQTAEPLETQWLPGLAALVIGAGAAFTVYRSLPDGSRQKGIVLAAGMVGLGLLTALFSGPQGGAGKFVHFLENMLHLSEQSAMVVNFVVRKGLHLAVYGSLAALAGLVAGRQGAALRQVWAAGLAWGVLHGILDEMTQSKTSLRTGSPWDVLLDTVGILIGLAIVTFGVGRRASVEQGGV